MARYRIGVDIGGTFTDLVLMDTEDGGLRVLKVPSTPGDPAAAVRGGVAEIVRRAGVAMGDIDLFVHGTTLAVNTLIQRSGADVGVLVTQGFEDLLELGRLRLPEPQNFFTDRVRPLVPRTRVRGIAERANARGEVLVPVDLEQVERAGRELAAMGCQAIAVCFLHAYRTEENEHLAVERLRSCLPDVLVRCSSAVWPQRREYERALVTTIDAHIGPVMRRYFMRLEEDLRGEGLRGPILSTKSNGGVMTARSAAERPAETLLSGPAAGVVGAVWVASAAGYPDVVTLDIGGTSADVSIVTGGAPGYSTEARSGDFPVILPAMDLQTIGAGGGSVAWVDDRGVLKVGPRSAGADPGPVCYGRGGADPTVTDAYVTLGILGDGGLVGGEVALNPELGRRALAKLGAQLQLSAEDAAWSVLEVATANMYSRFVPLMASRGVDADTYSLLAYGGAGPTHVFLLAREVGIRRVVVPVLPGALCALGCLVADLRADFVRSFDAELSRTPPEALREALDALDGQARAWLQREAIPVRSVQILHSADMRYRGQSFEINVPLPDLGGIRAAFQRAYEAIYGYGDPEAAVEMVDLRAQVVGMTPKPPLRAAAGVVRAPAPDRGARRLYHGGGWTEARLYARADLLPGHTFAGPAIVEQYDTTAFVPPGFSCHVDAMGNIVGEKVER